MNRWVTDKKIFDSINLGDKYVKAEKFDLDKFDNENDTKVFSYIRGYVWRNFGVRIKQPDDELLYYLISLALDANERDNKNR